MPTYLDLGAKIHFDGEPNRFRRMDLLWRRSWRRDRLSFLTRARMRCRRVLRRLGW